MVHPTNVFSWPAHHGRWNRVSARLVVVGHEWDGLKIGAPSGSSEQIRGIHPLGVL
jgi:hypothetical protein